MTLGNSKLALVCCFTSLLCAAGPAFGQAQWPYWGGTHAFNRYSPAGQIDQDNVNDLEILWRRPAVDQSISAAFPQLRVFGNLRGTPIYVNGVLYASNGVGLAEAFDPASGASLWVQQLDQPSLSEAQGQSARGVEYWSDGQRDQLLVIRKGWLYALDPANGEPLAGFGTDGRVNLVPPGATTFSYNSGGPIVVNDEIVIAGTVDGAGDSGATWRDVISEDVRGYDVRSGEHLWTFHAVPDAGEFGYDSWGNDSAAVSGDLGSWCCLSAD
ncbi:MAG: hypothetical protein RL120_01255, partial [Gammaproteobacteria bacterium]